MEDILIVSDGGVHHAFFGIEIPFIPRFNTGDFQNSSGSIKSRIEIIIQRQVRFINDMHNIITIEDELALNRVVIGQDKENIIFNKPAFELRYVLINGKIHILFFGKVVHSDKIKVTTLCKILYQKFVAHFPMEDPFNYPLRSIDKESIHKFLMPFPLSNIAKESILEIRKYEDFNIINPRNQNPSLQGFFPHRFIPTFDLSAMGRFLETLILEDQSCVVSIWLRPVRLGFEEIKFIMRRISEINPKNIAMREKRFQNMQNIENSHGETDIKDGFTGNIWKELLLEERYTDLYNTYWPTVNRKNHLFEFKIQIIGAKQAPISVMEALGSELLGNTFKEEPRLWRYIQPITEDHLAVTKYNFRFMENNFWDSNNNIWQNVHSSTPEEITIARRLTRLVTPTEAAGPFRLPIPPESGYLPGIQVRDEPFVAPFSSTERNNIKKVRLGKIVHHGQLTDNEFSIPLHDLTSHILIGGTTGTGKTNTCLSILSKLWKEHNIPFLVMYPIDKTDYRVLMADRKIAESLLIYTVGDETTTPFRFNPFYIPNDILLRTHISSLMRCFHAAFSMWDPIPSIYRTALYELYKSHGWNIYNGKGGDANVRIPTMDDFYETLMTVSDSMTNEFDPEAQRRIRQSVEVRIKDLLMNAGSVVNSIQPAPMATILERPTVMEIGRVGSQQDIALIMAFIMMCLVEELQSRYKNLSVIDRQKQGLRHVTLIEEAHRIMSRSPSATNEDLANPAAKGGEEFANILAEIRGFGEGIFIAEQIPVQLVNGAIGNTMMKIMHRLEDYESFDLFTNILNLNNRQREYTRSLSQGNVIVRDKYGNPNLVMVDNYLDEYQNEEDRLIFDDSDKALILFMESKYKQVIIPDLNEENKRKRKNKNEYQYYNLISNNIDNNDFKLLNSYIIEGNYVQLSAKLQNISKDRYVKLVLFFNIIELFQAKNSDFSINFSLVLNFLRYLQFEKEEIDTIINKYTQLINGNLDTKEFLDETE